MRNLRADGGVGEDHGLLVAQPLLEGGFADLMNAHGEEPAVEGVFVDGSLEGATDELGFLFAEAAGFGSLAPLELRWLHFEVGELFLGKTEEVEGLADGGSPGGDPLQHSGNDFAGFVQEDGLVAGNG